MAKNEATEPQISPDDKALQQRVEVIMNGVNPENVGPNSQVEPTIDIFNDPRTAPAVSADVLKEIGADNMPLTMAPVASAVASTETTLNDQTTLTETTVVPEDPETDKAVNDIVASESDAVLAAEDAEAKKVAGDAIVPVPKGWKSKFKRLMKLKRTWAVIAIILLVIFAIPFTRYTILGLFIERSVSVIVSDSTTNTAVSAAEVNIDGVMTKTNGEGKATLKVPIGKSSITIKKQYYKTTSQSYFVGLKSSGDKTIIITATGRQVPITVINKITGKPLAAVEIKTLGTTAKTNSQGKAIIVLPTNSKSDTAEATITAAGYNTAKTRIQITNQSVPVNTIALTPTGQIYFLSNLNGTLDVVKTNLDGSGRKTVLAGTGKEDKASTSLLASRDWRYLVLKSARNSSQPALYLIDTSSDKVISFDSDNAVFSLIGWYNHNFMYSVSRNDVSPWQNAQQVVKSYNADSGRLSQIDQTSAEGTADSYANQSFANFYITDGQLTYTTQWYANSNPPSVHDISAKKASIRGILPNGQSKKDYQTISNDGLSYIQAALYEPKSVYYQANNYTTNQSTFYKFEDQKISTISSINQNTLNQSYPTFLLSPNNNQTFWTELRDGKNSLFLGDANAQDKKSIAPLSEYSPYGWFSDNYLLVSKSSSELYIIPAGNLSTIYKPIKITDYYKPSQTYDSYGYGYGGI